MNPRWLTYKLFLCFSLILSIQDAFCQRGAIIRPASTNVLDPNGDGFVSKTAAGFSNDGYYADEFELTMFGIPKLGGDVPGDNIGNVCGITDLIPDNQGYSVYAVRDASDNLIFRFRVGDDNPSVEAWTILLDTDNSIGAADANATSFNPGFEIDITLIKRNNSGVLVYNIDGTENCPSPVLFYDIDSHFQISIGDEVSCGDPDYFYDFYVPLADIAAALGINVNTGLRYVAVTNVSATCAMDGNIADIGGVDNNDPTYSGCETCAFEDLVNNQCPTAIVDLCETCAGFEKDKVSKPIIDVPIRAGQTVITGSTVESDIFIRLQVFTNIAPPGSPPAWGAVPREEKSAYTVGTLWSITIASPLLAYDKIVAIAQKDEFSVPCGASGDQSSSTSVTVVAPNTPPVALDQTVDVTEDAQVQITLTATDAENDPLVYTLVALPGNGTLAGAPPNVTYTPDPDYSGGDSFTFEVNDGIFTSAVGTVTINVLPVNDAPVSDNLSVSTPEDTPVATTLTAFDADGDALVFTVITQPVNGILTGTPPNLTYTPNLNYFGQDNFTFMVNDGQVDSELATVSVTVTPVGDDAPIADAQSVSTPEETPVAIVLTGSDPDFDPLTFIIATGPSQGTLSGTPPNVTYSPNANYFGPDSFTFHANDGTLNSADVTISITVTPVNDVPVAFDQSVPYDFDTPKAITLTASDPDSDPLTYTITVQPANGILTGTAPNITYTPNSGYTGADSFKFVVNDGTVDSNEATVSLNLTPGANVPPVAADQSVSTAEDSPVQLVLTATDDNGDAVTFVITQSPVNGTLNASGATVTYTPNPDYNGADSFQFQASDGSLLSNVATVNITVTPVNDAPIANSQSVATDRNTSKNITLTGSDVEGDALTFSVVSTPDHGTVNVTGTTATYTPGSNYVGPDSFTFLANDGALNSAVATVSIVVNQVGGPPVAVNKSVSTPEDTPIDVDLATLVSDPDGNPLSHTVVQQPNHGTLVVNGTVVTYTPDGDYSGRDTLAFMASDGYWDSNVGKVFITVVVVNDVPVVADQNIITVEDVAASVELTGTDIDGGSLTFTILTPPANGTLTGIGASLTYTPDTDYSGPDSFTYKANDGSADSNVATVSITVTPLNDAPFITPLASLPPTKEDSLLRVCLNVIDVDGDAVDYNNPVNTKGGGTMVRDVAPYDFCYIFTPPLNYNGESFWTMAVTDLTGLTGQTPAELLVLPVNDVPVALNDYGTISANATLSLNLLANDLPIADPYQEFYDIYEADSSDVLSVISIINGPFHGAATLSPDKATIEYKPTSFTFVGADSIKYQVCDSGYPSLCDTAVLFIDVTENDFPFKVYEGISPNNDGLNDYLHIDAIDKHPDNIVRIFDRFNNLVWEGSNYDNEGIRWEGRANNGLGSATLPEGTYYYTVYLQGTGELFSGYVILKEK